MTLYHYTNSWSFCFTWSTREFGSLTEGRTSLARGSELRFCFNISSWKTKKKKQIKVCINIILLHLDINMKKNIVRFSIIERSGGLRGRRGSNIDWWALLAATASSISIIEKERARATSEKMSPGIRIIRIRHRSLTELYCTHYILLRPTKKNRKRKRKRQNSSGLLLGLHLHPKATYCTKLPWDSCF